MSKDGAGPVTPAQLLNQVQQQGRDGALPPVHLWNPPLCENVNMRIARDGTWYYLDSPIGRSQMVRLFSRVLRYDDDGCHYLVTPVEKIRIEVECAPFLITQMRCTGSGDGQIVELETSTGEVFSCDAEHPLWVEYDVESGDPVPLVHVRSRLNGLLHRNVYYRLIELGRPRRIDGEQILALRSSGEWFSLGRM